MISFNAYKEPSLLHEWVCEHNSQDVTPPMIKLVDKILFPARYWFLNTQSIFIKYENDYYLDKQEPILNSMHGLSRVIVNISTVLLSVPSLLVGVILKIIAIAFVKQEFKFNFTHSWCPEHLQNWNTATPADALQILSISEEDLQSFETLNQIYKQRAAGVRGSQARAPKPTAIKLEVTLAHMNRAYLTIVNHFYPNDLAQAKTIVATPNSVASSNPIKEVELNKADKLD